MPRKYTVNPQTYAARRERWKAEARAKFFDGSSFDNSSGPNGCWIWLKGKNQNGYGVVSYNGQIFGAHALAYIFEKGPIPEGLEIDHLCRNPSCVNPKHLEAVTHAVNVERATRLHCCNGHLMTVENRLETAKGSRACRTCRIEFLLKSAKSSLAKAIAAYPSHVIDSVAHRALKELENV